MSVLEGAGLTPMMAWSAHLSVTRLTGGGEFSEDKFVRDCSTFLVVCPVFGGEIARGIEKGGIARDSVPISAVGGGHSIYAGKFVPDATVLGMPWWYACLASLSLRGFLALPLVGYRNITATGKKVKGEIYDSNSNKADYTERGKRKVNRLTRVHYRLLPEKRTCFRG
jgi:hypothetical protein